MVYLIHFEKKISHAQHYIGYSKDMKTFEKRMKHHGNGNGASILKALNEKGIKYHVVRIWPDADGNYERKLKKRKNAKFLCPFCNPDKYHNNGVKK